MSFTTTKVSELTNKSSIETGDRLLGDRNGSTFTLTFNGTAIANGISGATFTSASVATGDKVLAQDVDDSDKLKTCTAQSIADLATPSSTTDNTLPRFNGTSGGLQTSGISVDDSDNLDISSGAAYRIDGSLALNATTLGSSVKTSSLTAVGTISTGTWQGDTIAVDQGGTGQTSYTDGQLLIGNSSNNELDKAALTGGNNVQITNGNGSVTISVSIDDFLRRTRTTGITASTTQSQGEGPLTTEINEVSTVGSANDTVTLPDAAAGKECWVFNNGSNTLQIFPASGDDLGQGVDTATTLDSDTNVKFVAYDSINWEEIGGSGGVSSPGSTTDNAIVRWDGTGGSAIQDSGITIGDSDQIDLSSGRIEFGDSGDEQHSIQSRGGRPTIYGENSTDRIETGSDFKGGFDISSTGGLLLSIDSDGFTFHGANVLSGAGVFRIRSTDSGITASTTQSQGEQPLTEEVNEVDTVGSAGDVVTLPEAVAGKSVLVINNGANSLDIYPASNDDAGGGANTAVSLASGASQRFTAFDAITWVQET